MFAFLFILFSQNLKAQYSYNSFTTNDGLISNDVTCTFKDSRGFLWVGTTQGLQVYNGKYFRTLRHHLLDSNSLSGDWVMSIAEDKNGFIWIGTDQGICRVHPGHLQCKQYDPAKKMTANVKDEYSKVIADSHGKIWALSSNYLLYLEKDSFICTEPTRYHGSICLGEKDELIYTVMNEVFIKNTITGTARKIETKLGEEVDFTTCYMDANGFYWLGTWGDGLYRFDHTWKNFKQFKWDPDPVNPSTTNIVSGIAGAHENIFAVTSNGLYTFKLSKDGDYFGRIFLTQYNPDIPDGLLNGRMSHIAVDSADNIWLSTAGGLNVSFALNREFKEMALKSGLTTDVLWKNGELITSSWYGAGIVFHTKDLRSRSNLRYVPENKNDLNNSQISGIDLDEKGNLWVATFNGLAYYDMEKAKTTSYLTREENGFATNRLNDVWINKKENEVWAANYDAGITRYKISTGEVTNLNIRNSQFMINDLVWSFYDAGDGNCWILTNSGVLVYNYNKGTWRSWIEISYQGSKIKLDRVQAVLKARDGSVWVGTSNGLFIYHNNEWLFKSIESGLPEREVNSVVQDKKGNMWIGFNQSVVCYSIHDGVTSVLSSSNGILLPPIHFIFLDPLTDRLFIVSDISYYEIDKEKVLQQHTESPLVYLEKFNVNGVSYYSTTDSFEIEKKYFSYKENNMEISFVTPNMGEIGNLRYSYRISNNDWSIPSENNLITLPGLPPGNYKVEIRATTDGSHWSKRSLTVNFTIRPPFWSTWWFRLLLAVFVLSGIVWWVRYLSTRKMKLKIYELEKEQAVERERSRLSRDMHDDLGSGLTKISILSEVVKKKMDKNEKVDTYLENISDSSRELVQSLNNIIWSLNTGNSTVSALLAYIREYASRFLESCEVELKFSSDNIQIDGMVSEQVKRNIYLVVKESLNNAVKHGKAKHIEMRVEKQGSHEVKITIHDDGSGLDQTKAGAGNGLKNMTKRMQEIDGDFSIKGEPGKGTTITLICKF